MNTKLKNSWLRSNQNRVSYIQKAAKNPIISTALSLPIYYIKRYVHLALEIHVLKCTAFRSEMVRGVNLK